MKNISTASAHWEDTLENGFGTISAESSQIFTETPYNFKARSESQAHITTPEELVFFLIFEGEDALYFFASFRALILSLESNGSSALYGCPLNILFF